jgi:Mlc titration factor MtfA (ptsG expression regulator)
MRDTFLFISFMAAFFLLRYWYGRKQKQLAYTNACPGPEINETDIVFRGGDAGITESQVVHILSKRHNYYRSLDEEQQKRFLRRLQNFMESKVFIIKDDEAVREMPVLVSAAAIQLTFGLKDYLLPFYKYIRIYPEEYLSDHSFAILAGNVQNNIITVAWNQILNGLSNNADGSNVGLHEMSHALYIQKMVMEKEYSRRFSSDYSELEERCALASRYEQNGEKNLYSQYADTNLQEFWAETIELFFEKPDELNTCYPEIFKAAALLLNQDPRQQANPVVDSKRTKRFLVG